MGEVDISDGIPRFKQNEDRVDTFVNGAEDENVSPRVGEDYPTIRKFLKTWSDRLNTEAAGTLAGKVDKTSTGTGTGAAVVTGTFGTAFTVNVPIAANADVDAATDDTKVMTSVKTKRAIDSKVPQTYSQVTLFNAGGSLHRDGQGNFYGMTPTRIIHKSFVAMRNRVRALEAASPSRTGITGFEQGGLLSKDSQGNYYGLTPTRIVHKAFVALRNRVRIAEAAIVTNASAIATLSTTVSGLGIVSSSGRPGGTVALIGESHNAQMFISPTRKNSLHWLNQLNMDPRVRHFFRVVYNGAVSGTRPDQYVTQLATAIATGARILVMGGYVNALAAGHTADQIWNGWASGAGPSGAASSFIGYKAMVIQALNAGMIVICPSDWGQTGMSSTTFGYLAILNDRIRQFCSTFAAQGAIYLDRNPIMWDGSTSTVGFRSGFMTVSDGTHAGTLGAYWLAKDAYNKLLPLIAASGRQLGSQAEIFVNGGLQRLANPGFTGTSGTWFGSGAHSGNVPTGWQVGVPSGWTVASLVQASTAEIVPGLLENVPEWVLTITASGAGTAYPFQALTASLLNAADKWKAGFEYSVDAGATNFYGCECQHLIQTDGSVNTQGSDNYSQYTGGPDYGAGPSEAHTRVLETPTTVVPAHATKTSWFFYGNCKFGAAGSATIRIRAPWLKLQGV